MKLSKIKKQITKGKIAIEHTDLESLTKVLKHFYPEDDFGSSGFFKYYYSSLGNKNFWVCNNHFEGKSFKDVDLLKFIEFEGKIIKLSKIKKELQNGTIAIECTDLESLTKVLKYFYPEDDLGSSRSSKYYFERKSFKDVDLLKLIESKY